MANRDAIGTCRVFQDGRRARIQILHPADYEAVYGDGRQDVEETLVHELSHIVLDGTDIPDNRIRETEQAIESFAPCLVSMRRLLAQK